MDRLLHALETTDLRTDTNINADTAVLVAERIPVETWNRFAKLEDFPRRLHLWQMVWSDGNVWVVEYPISPPHENAVGYISGEFPQCGLRHGHADISGVVNGQQVTCQPDFSYGPGPDPRHQLPQGFVYARWRTVIIEVMYTQEWSTVHLKLPMYRERDGLQYIFLLKMSPDLVHWSYELYDVGNNPPNPPSAPPRSSLRLQRHHLQPNEEFVIRFDTRRVLGLRAGAQLPPEFPHDWIVLDVVALARLVRAVNP